MLIDIRLKTQCQKRNHKYSKINKIKKNGNENEIQKRLEKVRKKSKSPE